MMHAETLDNFNAISHLYKQKNNYSFYESGQLRRAKMHAAQLIGAIDTEQMLPPVLYQLLEASLVLETTDCRRLAAHLKRTPATIRSEFKSICEILGSAENTRNDGDFNSRNNKNAVNI